MKIMENSYTLKEIMEKNFQEMNGHLIEIKSQVIRTNGRVNSLEKSRVQIWTAISVILGLAGGIIGLSIYAIDSKINKGIQSALLEYDIENYGDKTNK